jgi:hypothetical protein
MFISHFFCDSYQISRRWCPAPPVCAKLPCKDCTDPPRPVGVQRRIQAIVSRACTFVLSPHILTLLHGSVVVDVDYCAATVLYESPVGTMPRSKEELIRYCIGQDDIVHTLITAAQAEYHRKESMMGWSNPTPINPHSSGPAKNERKRGAGAPLESEAKRRIDELGTALANTTKIHEVDVAKIIHTHQTLVELMTIKTTEEKAELEAKRVDDLATLKAELEAKRVDDLATLKAELEASAAADLATLKAELEVSAAADLATLKAEFEASAAADLATLKVELEASAAADLATLKVELEASAIAYLTRETVELEAKGAADLEMLKAELKAKGVADLAAQKADLEVTGAADLAAHALVAQTALKQALAVSVTPPIKAFACDDLAWWFDTEGIPWPAQIKGINEGIATIAFLEPQHTIYHISVALANTVHTGKPPLLLIPEPVL